MDLIEKMINYINTDDNIFVDVKCDDISDFNVAIINLLEWLKLQYKRQIWLEEGKKDFRKPLSIPLDTSWGCLLANVLISTEFNNYFDIDVDKITLSSKMSEDEKKAIYKRAFDGYNPIKYIK